VNRATHNLVELSSTDRLVASSSEVDVRTLPDGDNLDLDSGLSNVDNNDRLVGLLLLTLGHVPDLLPFLDQPRPVPNKHRRALIDDLQDLDASVLSSLLQRLPLLGGEGRRGGDDAAVLGGDAHEVGRGLEEGLEECRGDLGDGLGELLGGGLGGGSSGSGLGRGGSARGTLLAGGFGRGDEDVDGVAGLGGGGDGNQRS
jgi:hypothetical protein